MKLGRTKKNGCGSGSDSDDEEQRGDEVVDYRAEKRGLDNGADTEIPYAGTVHPGEHETEVGLIRDIGGSSRLGEQRDRDDDGKGDSPKQKKFTTAMGQKERCPKAMSSKVRTAEEMRMKPSITLLKVGTRTTDKAFMRG